MDQQRRRELWAIALQNFKAAKLAVQRRWYNVSVGRSYYAAFTAMWVALGDPHTPHRRWEHEGIVHHFVWGQWKTDPDPLPRELRKALSILYQYRLKADYHGLKVTANEAQEGLTTAAAVLAIVADAFALPKRGIKP